LEEQLSNDVTLGVPLFDSAHRGVVCTPCLHFPCFFSNLAYKIKTNDMMWAVALER